MKSKKKKSKKEKKTKIGRTNVQNRVMEYLVLVKLATRSHKISEALNIPTKSVDRALGKLRKKKLVGIACRIRITKEKNSKYKIYWGVITKN